MPCNVSDLPDMIHSFNFFNVIVSLISIDEMCNAVCLHAVLPLFAGKHNYIST